MRGSIYKRGQSWTVVYDEPSTDGDRRQRSKGGFSTKREAQQHLTEQLARLDIGSYSAPAKLTVSAYLDGQWLPTVAGRLRPNTIATYRTITRSHITPRIGGVRLQALTPGHLNGLYAALTETGLSAATVRLVHAIIGRSLRDAHRWGLVPRNVARLADPPANTRTQVRAWTAAELRRFLDHVDGDPLRALWRLAATTGLRRGELAGLTWRALDLDAARLSVDQQLLASGTFGPPKSNQSRRTIALDTDTVVALRAHQSTQTLERDFAGPAYRDGDLVFADPLGGPIPPQRLSRTFVAHREAAGIPAGTLHVLRHTAATLMLVNGVPVHVVAARLGDRPETILQSYAHLLPQSDEHAARALADALVSIS
jgi:integrase